MKGLYRRKLSAGRLTKEVVYSRSIPSADVKTRQKRKEATRAAQKFINCRNQTERLALKIAANFDCPASVFATLTFNEKHLPERKTDVLRLFERWRDDMRKAARLKGGAFSYIRSIEGVSLNDFPDALDPCAIDYEKRPWNDSKKWSKEGITVKKQKGINQPVRFHIHVILNLSKSDYETARSLWPHGHVYIGSMKVNEPETFIKLASYMTKDTRNGETKNGERCFSCSKGLAKPTITGEWVEEDTLSIPADVQEVLEDELSSSRWAYCHRVGYIVKSTCTPDIYYSKRRNTQASTDSSIKQPLF